MSYIENLFSNTKYSQATNVANLLKQYSVIGIVSHASPDADALGSTLALAHGLIALGKTVYIGNASSIPDYLEWLQYPSPLLKTFANTANTPEVIVILDCGDALRLGEIQEHILSYPTINIDHHINNPHFADIYNWSDASMAATGQMVAAILYALNVPLQNVIAENLYIAISSDTGNMTYDNTDEDVFLLCAYFLSQGMDLMSIRRQLDNVWTVKRMHLWGKLMQNFQLEYNDQIALVCVHQEDLIKHQASSDDLEGFVEHLRLLKNLNISALIREDSKIKCKVSLRSTGPINVREIVAKFGGGGHHNAAGAVLNYSIQESKELLLSAIISWLKEHNY